MIEEKLAALSEDMLYELETDIEGLFFHLKHSPSPIEDFPVLKNFLKTLKDDVSAAMKEKSFDADEDEEGENPHSGWRSFQEAGQ